MAAAASVFLVLLLAVAISVTHCYLSISGHSPLRCGRSICGSSTVVYSSRRERRASTSSDVQKDLKGDYVVGEGIPDDILRHQCIYDMILVERFSSPTKTSFGLFLPVIEGKDRKHLGKVLSKPTSYGLESEQGRLAPFDEICPYNIGDMVFIRDPWGIGPLNIELGPRCFSFHKAEHITGVVK